MGSKIRLSDIWNKVYVSDASFFGDDPSNFALECYKELKKYGAKKILELGCGQGRDTIFFASNGIVVIAIESSKVAIDALSKTTIQKNFHITPMIHNLSEDNLFNDSYFDVVYSHMFLSFPPNARFNLLFRQVISQLLLYG